MNHLIAALLIASGTTFQLAVEPTSRGTGVEPTSRGAGVEPTSRGTGVEPTSRDAGGGQAPAARGAGLETLAGTWAVAIPGAGWTSQRRVGNATYHQTNIHHGAGMGTLQIGTNGSYLWRAADGSVRGRGVLVEIHKDPASLSSQYRGRRFWKLRDGRRELSIVMLAPNHVVLHRTTYFSTVAEGARIR